VPAPIYKIDSLELTVREREVTALVAEGHQNKEIARRLGTTENTIKKSLKVLFDKTGNWSRLELALWQLTRENKR
jgi:two-component system nitrate/nitrite response regulator NarL